mgnify:CR=1 FL=1
MLLGKPWHLLAESPGTASTVLLRPLCSTGCGAGPRSLALCLRGLSPSSIMMALKAEELSPLLIQMDANHGWRAA